MTNSVGLLDTNILVYAMNEGAPQHGIARDLVDDVLRGAVLGCLAMQVLAEFCATVTHPRKLEVPLEPWEACEEVAKLLSCPVPVLYQSREALPIFLDLVAEHSVTRQDVHDAALAATMLANGIRRIYTANTRDFLIFEGIEAVNPFQGEPQQE